MSRNFTVKYFTVPYSTIGYSIVTIQYSTAILQQYCIVSYITLLRTRRQRLCDRVSRSTFLIGVLFSVMLYCTLAFWICRHRKFLSGTVRNSTLRQPLKFMMWIALYLDCTVYSTGLDCTVVLYSTWNDTVPELYFNFLTSCYSMIQCFSPTQCTVQYTVLVQCIIECCIGQYAVYSLIVLGIMNNLRRYQWQGSAAHIVLSHQLDALIGVIIIICIASYEL